MLSFSDTPTILNKANDICVYKSLISIYTVAKECTARSERIKRQRDRNAPLCRVIIMGVQRLCRCRTRRSIALTRRTLSPENCQWSEIVSDIRTNSSAHATNSSHVIVPGPSILCSSYKLASIFISIYLKIKKNNTEIMH